MSGGWTQQLLLVMAGGALGAAGRFCLGGALLRSFGNGIPWGTLAVNLIGCLAMGLLIGVLTLRGQSSTALRLFLATGVLGGFTTFSAFALDFVTLVERGRVDAALAYAAASVGLSIVAVFAGLTVMRAL